MTDTHDQTKHLWPSSRTHPGCCQWERNSKLTRPVFHYVKQAWAEITVTPGRFWKGRTNGSPGLSLVGQAGLQITWQPVLRQGLTQKSSCFSADFGVNSLTGFLSWGTFQWIQPCSQTQRVLFHEQTCSCQVLGYGFLRLSEAGCPNGCLRC